MRGKRYATMYYTITSLHQNSKPDIFIIRLMKNSATQFRNYFKPTLEQPLTGELFTNASQRSNS